MEYKGSEGDVRGAVPPLGVNRKDSDDRKGE